MEKSRTNVHGHKFGSALRSLYNITTLLLSNLRTHKCKKIDICSPFNGAQ